MITALVVSQNLHRRHLSTSQRAMIVEKVAHGSKPGPRSKEIGPIGTISKAEAARLGNVGETSIHSARKVRTKGVPELAEAVEKGDITVDRASKIARLRKRTRRLGRRSSG